jgi:hypothetical protein
MNGIEKHAAFYRGYLPDDRSLVPLTVLLSATLALWLLVYLVAAVGRGPTKRGRCARRLRNLHPGPSACEFADPAKYLRRGRRDLTLLPWRTSGQAIRLVYS